jgi:magnesium transporter
VVCGEAQNFMAYAFSPAIIVTPLGAISVVVSAILSILFLGEKLNFSGVCGIMLCIIGSTIIVFHGPPSTATETVPEFMSFVLHPLFLTYFALNIILVVWLIFKIGPLYGDTQPIVYLAINSLAGAFLVNSAQGSSD